MRIFLDDIDRRKFLVLLGDMVDIFHVECWDFCLMNTHYHLCISNPLPNLSEAFQYLNGNYAIWWNSRHGHVGHVFQGRFRDQIVQRDSYLLTLCRYIALNPVRARLVKDPGDWPWSSYRCLAGLTSSPSFLCEHGVLQQFGGAPERQRESYVQHVCGGLAMDDADAERFRSQQRVIGDRAFKQAMNTSRSAAAAPLSDHRPAVLGE